jgi:hypothetical protein
VIVNGLSRSSQANPDSTSMRRARLLSGCCHAPQGCELGPVRNVDAPGPISPLGIPGGAEDPIVPTGIPSPTTRLDQRISKAKKGKVFHHLGACPVTP